MHIHAHTHLQTSVLMLHTDTQAQVLITHDILTHTGTCSYAHTRKDVFQGEGAVQRSLASPLQKLPAAPTVSGQL